MGMKNSRCTTNPLISSMKIKMINVDAGISELNNIFDYLSRFNKKRDKK